MGENPYIRLPINIDAEIQVQNWCCNGVDSWIDDGEIDVTRVELYHFVESVNGVQGGEDRINWELRQRMSKNKRGVLI